MAFDAFRAVLWKYEKNGDIEIRDERPLSKEPLKIDIMVIKKKRNVTIKTSFGRLFRAHNIIEYKSPVDTTSALTTFDKVVHGYVGIYAAQEDVRLTDITATMVFYDRPAALFDSLKKDFCYKILPQGDGIYYIIHKGAVLEKSLAIQIVVCAELPDSEGAIKLVKEKISGKDVALAIGIAEKDKSGILFPSHWGEHIINKNIEKFLTEEEEMTKAEKNRIIKLLDEKGWLKEIRQESRQESRQEFWQEGAQDLASLWEKGYSLAEAKKELQLA